MSWFSFLRKNKQEPAPGDGEFYSQAEDNVVSGRARAKKKDEPIDPVLPEKKRARRRLIGAVALTLGLVIGLPMVLDSEPKPVSGDIEIRIPSRDKQSKLSAGRPAASSATASTSEKIIETPQPANDAPTPTAAPPVNEKPAVAEKPAAVKAEPAKAEPAKAVKAEAKDNKTKPATDAAQGKFVIQVAALATQQKVNELQARLTKAGLKSHTQKVSVQDGERIRVRVGPFASKSEAEKTCAKLDKMSLKCTILPG